LLRTGNHPQCLAFIGIYLASGGREGSSSEVVAMMKLLQFIEVHRIIKRRCLLRPQSWKKQEKLLSSSVPDRFLGRPDPLVRGTDINQK
jgi:hypothetical protein